MTNGPRTFLGLTRAQGAYEIACRDSDDPDSDPNVAAARIARDAWRRAHDVVQDLDDLSAVQAGHLARARAADQRFDASDLTDIDAARESRDAYAAANAISEQILQLCHAIERDMRRDIGWCNAPDHQFDHPRSDSCIGFVSDAEQTAALLAEATSHDREASDPGVEARYVQHHRPY